MDSDTFSERLSPAELAFVVSIMGSAPKLLEDPLSAWSVERVDAVLRQARGSLAASGYITVQPGDKVAVDTAVAALVGALAYAEAALTVTRVVGAEASLEARQVHFASGLIVEQEQQSDGLHCLTALRDREVVVQRLAEYLHLAGQSAPPAELCMLPTSTVHEAHIIAAVEGANVCARLLADAGAPAAVASSLAQAMACPVCQGSLEALELEGQEARRVGGFMLLDGGKGLWLLRPLLGDGESRLEAIPCDAAFAIGQVDELARLVVRSAQP